MYKRTKNVKSYFIHCITSLNRDSDIREAATKMSHTQLLVKLSEGDLIAREAKYHKKSVTKFSNQYRGSVNTKNTNIKVVQEKHERIARAKVLMYIERSFQYRENEEVAPFVKLSTVRKYYYHCLGPLNVKSVTANVSRLKESILHLNQNLEATTFKNEVYISYKDYLAAALHYSREHSIESEAAHLSRAANILRSDMLKQKQNFNGYFT